MDFPLRVFSPLGLPLSRLRVSLLISGWAGRVISLMTANVPIARRVRSVKAALGVCISMLGLAGSLWAQPQSDWRMIGQIGGPVRAVVNAGNYAYVGVGLRMVVLDVTNPAAPIEVGSTTPFPDFVQGLAVSGTWVFVAAGSGGLRIVDVSDPAAPVEVGAWISSGYAEGVAVRGSEVFVADGPHGLRVIDVSDPAQPQEIGHAFAMNYAFQVALSGNTAVVASAGAGLLVADVSDPAHPIEQAVFATPGYAVGVSVAGGKAYIAASWGGVQVVDVADPAHPVLHASVATSGWALGAVVSAGRLYVADGGYGLLIKDANTLATLGRFETNSPIYSAVSVAGSYAYVADQRRGLRIVDVSNPALPVASGSMSTIVQAVSVSAMGNRAVVITPDGLQVLDISNPAHPQIRGFFALSNRVAAHVLLMGSYAILSGGNGANDGLHVIDISDPLHPVQIGFLSLINAGYGPFRDIKQVGNTLYAANEWGLVIVDISNPAQPQQIGYTQLTDWPGPAAWNAVVGVAIASGYAYMPAPDGLKIVDISNPANPFPVAAYTGSGHDNGAISISGSYAFMSGMNGMSVLSLANPTVPALVVDAPAPGTTFHSILVGNQLMMADAAVGLSVIDISNPAQPERYARLPVPGYAQDVAHASGLVLVASNGGGVAIFGTTTPAVSSVASHTAVPIASSVPGSVDPADDSQPLIPSLPSTTQTLTVTSVSDSGAGTLRQALQSATAGTLITFNPTVFPPLSPASIHLLSPLPNITQNGIVIDASNAGVVLDGAQAGSSASGLSIYSSDNVVRGLQILRFGFSGINVSNSRNIIGGARDQGTGLLGQGNLIGSCGSQGIRIEGDQSANNWIAGNLLGIGLNNEPLANFNGISIAGARANLIGGSAPALRNVVSANQSIGITLTGGAHDNVIAGNLIGTNLNGTQVAGLQQYGVVMQSPRNQVGGLTSGERNIIAGNVLAGIGVNGSRRNAIVGNFIGLNLTGDTVLPNGMGVDINGEATHTLVQGNVFGPTGTQALSIGDNETSFTSIVGNLFGTNAAGTTLLSGGGALSLDGGYLTRIGGLEPSERNLIAGGLSIGFGWSTAIVIGNFIGTDITGTLPLNNQTNGVTLYGARRPIIGGLSLAEANLIGGNGLSGIQVHAGTHHAVIAGNRIGVGWNGEPLGNGQNAIQVDFSTGVVIQGNTITGSGTQGVVIYGGTGDVIRRNSIYGNGGNGIALNNGGNGGIAPPQWGSITATLVTGTTRPYGVIEIYSDAGDEGRHYEGSVRADAAGGFQFSAVGGFQGPRLTATATDRLLGTSGFSSPATALVPYFFLWQQDKFTPGELADSGISGPGSDPDTDGLANLIEYALGLEPKAVSTSVLPELSTTATDWVYTYTRPTDRPDITYVVEVSTNLTTWTAVSGTHEWVSSAGANETWQAKYPLGSAANAFFRLKVTQQ